MNVHPAKVPRRFRFKGFTAVKPALSSATSPSDSGPKLSRKRRLARSQKAEADTINGRSPSFAPAASLPWP